MKESIKIDGQKVPIIVNQNNVIIDGYTRFQICKELHIKPKSQIIKFKSTLEEIKYILTANAQRRDLSIFERFLAGERLYDEIKKFNLQYLRSGKKGKSPYGHTFDYVGKAIGISTSNMQRLTYIKKYGRRMDFGHLRWNSARIWSVYRTVRSRTAVKQRGGKKDPNQSNLMPCPECGGTGRVPVDEN